MGAPQTRSWFVIWENDSHFQVPTVPGPEIYPRLQGQRVLATTLPSLHLEACLPLQGFVSWWPGRLVASEVWDREIDGDCDGDDGDDGEEEVEEEEKKKKKKRRRRKEKKGEEAGEEEDCCHPFVVVLLVLLG